MVLYPFIIGAEILSKLLICVENINVLRIIKLARNAPAISHLYVNDLILFDIINLIEINVIN